MFARYLLTAAALVVHGVLGQTTTNTTQFGGSGPNAIILTGPTVIKQCELVKFEWEGGQPPYTIFIDRFKDSMNVPPHLTPTTIESTTSLWNQTYIELYINVLSGMAIVFGVGEQQPMVNVSNRATFFPAAYVVRTGDDLSCLTNRNKYPNDTIPIQEWDDTGYYDSPDRPRPGDLSWMKQNQPEAESSVVTTVVDGTTSTITVGSQTTGSSSSKGGSGNNGGSSDSGDSSNSGGSSGGSSTGSGQNVPLIQYRDKGLSIGAIVGIAVGGVVGLIGLLIGLFFLFCRRRYYDWKETRDHKHRMNITAESGGFDMIEPYEIQPSVAPPHASGGYVDPYSSRSQGASSEQGMPLLAAVAPRPTKAQEAAMDRGYGPSGSGPRPYNDMSSGAYSAAGSSSGAQNTQPYHDNESEDSGSTLPVHVHEDGGRLAEQPRHEVPPLYNPEWSERQG